MIPGLAEYVDIDDRVDLLTSLYNKVKDQGEIRLVKQHLQDTQLKTT